MAFDRRRYVRLYKLINHHYQPNVFRFFRFFRFRPSLFAASGRILRFPLDHPAEAGVATGETCKNM
jgi:hypothetical protein